MSSYFSNFKKVLYYFGDETTPVAIQNLSKYVPLIDEIADEISAYIEYEIGDFERPDSLSHRLYGNSEYDWTFFLMNDKLREGGWPLTKQNLYKAASERFFPDWTINLGIETADSASELAKIYPVGQEVKLGNYDMIVKSKNIQIGTITVQSPYYSIDSDFSQEGVLRYSEDFSNQKLVTVTREVFGVRHYVDDSDNQKDYFFSNELLTPITNLEWLESENEKLKKIRVIRKDTVESVVGKFKSLTGL